MDTRLKKSGLILAAVMVLIMLFPATVNAGTFGRHDLTMDITGKGNLYFECSDKMDYFVRDSKGGFNPSCRVTDGRTYRMSSYFENSVAPDPAEGWYFDGFYDSKGSRVYLPHSVVDIIRIQKKGITFYDYVLSYDHYKYSGYPEEAYREDIKNYTSSVYGTRTYKTLFSTDLYTLPLREAHLYPVFREKGSRHISAGSVIEKKAYDDDFYILKGEEAEGAHFRSSSSRTLSVDKNTGLAKIRSSGIATVTVTFDETERLKKETFKIKVKISPEASEILSARRAGNGYVEVTWKTDLRCSGYELDVYGPRDKSRDIGGKTVSRKYGKTKIKIKNGMRADTVKLRKYKRSCGEKLYGKSAYIKIK